MVQPDRGSQASGDLVAVCYWIRRLECVERKMGTGGILYGGRTDHDGVLCHRCPVWSALKKLTRLTDGRWQLVLVGEEGQNRFVRALCRAKCR